MSTSSNNNISLPLSVLDELALVVSRYIPSLDFGIDFNNLPDDVLVTGQAQPLAAYPNPSALESSSAQINEELHNQLFKSLKESVAEASRRSRGPTTPAGQLTAVCFKLPEAFYRNDIDVEKLVPREANQNPNTQIERKFSFFQRLGGWSIERKWRSNGKNSDMVI
ncbi:hypothetical protein L3X38_037591 [Prunus dulcis]|uniref:Uncharacterized protein n=1 Tax=Prunus dulcis TaxID=3755 RepID=A0AAD4V4Y8_PRUDU|nr:hypothetical protein L3X38_037591 [Prunus dulcis]